MSKQSYLDVRHKFFIIFMMALESFLLQKHNLPIKHCEFPSRLTVGNNGHLNIHELQITRLIN